MIVKVFAEKLQVSYIPMVQDVTYWYSASKASYVGCGHTHTCAHSEAALLDANAVAESEYTSVHRFREESPTHISGWVPSVTFQETVQIIHVFCVPVQIVSDAC